MLRDFDPTVDRDKVYNLWCQIFPQWNISQHTFDQVLSLSVAPGPHSCMHLVAEQHGDIVGFVALQHDASSNEGHILALMVAPQVRRRGIARQLHAAALDRFAHYGVRQVWLGRGSPRFWPGVPSDLEAGVRFFEAQGWTWDHTVVDMVRDVQDFETPVPVQERVQPHEIVFSLLTEHDLQEFLDFEERTFPNWVDGVRNVINLGDSQDILLARDTNNRIVGALTLYTEHSHADRLDVIWKDQLGEKAGALGVVGVAPEARDRGIGTALVARGTEIVRDRGASICFLGWVWAINFYRRLGYREWQSYHMSAALFPPMLQ